jgi:hypothetical protein
MMLAGAPGRAAGQETSPPPIDAPPPPPIHLNCESETGGSLQIDIDRVGATLTIRGLGALGLQEDENSFDGGVDLDGAPLIRVRVDRQTLALTIMNKSGPAFGLPILTHGTCLLNSRRIPDRSAGP